MDRMILAAYNGLTCAALAVCILALTVLVKSYKDGDYYYPQKKSTFWIAVALTGWMGAECISRAWWSIWKSGYISREPVSWMLDHPIVLACVTVKIGCGILFVKALTEDSPQGRLWKICAGLIGCVVILGVL
jgi:hypothetical protein